MAAEEQVESEHKCPYGGDRTYECICGAVLGRPCGRYGYLCDRCREDRADKRAAAHDGTVERLDELSDRVYDFMHQSNGHVSRLWKLEQAVVALTARLSVTGKPNDEPAHDMVVPQRATTHGIAAAGDSTNSPQGEPTPHEQRTCGNCRHIRDAWCEKDQRKGNTPCAAWMDKHNGAP